MTSEHKRKISEANKGKKRSAEQNRRNSEANKGKILTAETRRKISESLKGHVGYWLGKKRTEETKRKMSDSSFFKGKKRSMEVKTKISKKLQGHIISEITRNKISKQHKGEKSRFWKGGVSSENKIIRSGLEFRLWRESVFARDKYICQKCDKAGVYLHPHHIINFAENKELRFILDNGITFCENCHWDFHKRFGKKNNTREQLEEFINIEQQQTGL